MKIINIVLGLLILMILSNCNDKDKNKMSGEEITVQFLKAESDAGKEFYLLDVRTTPEYQQGRLEFSDDMIPYDSLNLYVDKFPNDKETTIYLFCRSGRRSGIATTYLRSLGYKNAYNVDGGIIAWQDAGFEIVSGN